MLAIKVVQKTGRGEEKGGGVYEDTSYAVFELHKQETWLPHFTTFRVRKEEHICLFAVRVGERGRRKGGTKD